MLFCERIVISNLEKKKTVILNLSRIEQALVYMLFINLLHAIH